MSKLLNIYVQRARLSLGDLYMYLCNYLKVIDYFDYELINQFKSVFIENIKYPALFGKTHLKDEGVVLACLERCASKLADKITELKVYIEK